MSKIQKMTCVLFGHSNIEEVFMGYHHCARCGELLGDSLGGVYLNANIVAVGHDCDTCRSNYKRLTWKDKLFTKKPFPATPPTERGEGS